MTELHRKPSVLRKGESGFCCGQSRRSFMKITTGMAAVSLMGVSGTWAGTGEPDGEPTWARDEWDPREPFLLWGEPLRVQPILMYTVARRREATSWRSWGGVLSEESSTEELERISKELGSLSVDAEFPLEILPPKKVKSVEETAQALKSDSDVVLVYAASGSGRLLQACVRSQGDSIIFVRRRSGPIYYWYEALSVAYLDTDNKNRRGTVPPRLGETHVDDVVVDDYEDVLWRLRALYGVKNVTGARIVALGGAWGKYAADAPQIAREKHKINIIEISYDEVARRIRSATADRDRVARAEKWTETYLSMPNTTLKTDRPFVVNAFLLYGIFKDLMRENRAPAFTIKQCMSTILPISRTTACLSLSLLNDEGLLAFCESDFVVIPAGILLRHLSGKPVFLHNSTFPHKGIVTCAHCTAPRRMDGKDYEPATILTHAESDYGAAPKVEMPIGQELTFIDPEYTKGRWVGFRGNVEDNPFYAICRSQQDVRIQGDWKRLINEVRDSHWMMAYGDYLEEVGYAGRKMGIQWENISDA